MSTISSLPSNEKNIEINLIGEITKLNWTGKFKILCQPNLRQRAEAAKLETALNGDLLTLDDNTRGYHRAIAQLQARIIEAPKWFRESRNGQELMDDNIVAELYKECLLAQSEWRKTIWGDEEPSAINGIDIKNSLVDKKLSPSEDEEKEEQAGE